MIDPVERDLSRYLAEQDRLQMIAEKQHEYFMSYCESECRQCEWLNIFGQCLNDGDFTSIEELERCPNGCWDLDDAHI